MARRKKKGSPWLKLPLIALALAMVASAVLAYFVAGRPAGPFQPPRQATPDPQTGMVLFEVPANVAPSELATMLFDQGLIGFPKLFKAFVRVTGKDRKIRAGYYYLPPSNSVLEITYKLTVGKMATKSVTIPEGKALWEVFGVLRRRDFPLDSLVFDSLATSGEFARELGLQSPTLEGYLFPDTYVLPWRVTERDVLRAMVERFQHIAAAIGDSSEVISNYGVHGWVTLASIVEKEAAVRSEQSQIAGVFYNRLRLGWSLGADPTVRYALRKMTGPLYYRDLDTDSPYNTRKFTGLPPTPICSPGRKALKASAYPDTTDMMFFVARDDGSRRHFFSRTNAEHTGFKDQAAENRRRNRLEKEKSAAQLEPEPEMPPANGKDG